MASRFSESFAHWRCARGWSGGCSKDKEGQYILCSIMGEALPEDTCLLGTLLQNAYATHPDRRAACDKGMSTHIAALVSDIEAAKQCYVPEATWSAESVGYFIQSVLQGALIFSKAKNSADVAHESSAHLRRYLDALFIQPRNTKRKEES